MPTFIDHARNPHLVVWLQRPVENEAGTGLIEKPGEGENIRWQSRHAEPTAHEIAMGDAVEQAYLDGQTKSSEFALSFNAAGLRTPSGGLWTALLVEQHMAQLGF